jgi:hypothetical protein
MVWYGMVHHHFVRYDLLDNDLFYKVMLEYSQVVRQRFLISPSEVRTLLLQWPTRFYSSSLVGG